MLDDLEEMKKVLSEVVYHVPTEKYIYFRNGSWQVGTPIGKETLKHIFEDKGIPDKIANKYIKESKARKIYTMGIYPGEEQIVMVHGEPCLNLWIPPTLKAKEGPFPTITKILQWLTNFEEAGQEWVIHWMAQKIQNPRLNPKIAVLFTTAQGGGKGTLAKIMRYMLGMENTAEISQNALESKFNGRWANKLFVLGDEVFTRSKEDNTNMLKKYIDGGSIEVEKKYQNQAEVESCLAMMFASNEPATPLIVEEGDRRYTVFANHSKVTEEYSSLLKNCWLEDKTTPTPEFEAEMAGFLFFLERLEVNKDLVKSPYNNKAKESLIAASLNSIENFFREMNMEGRAELWIENFIKHNSTPYTDRETVKHWNRPEGVELQKLYAIYKLYCRENGMNAFKKNNFHTSLLNLQKQWVIQVIDDVEYVAIPRRMRLRAV